MQKLIFAVAFVVVGSISNEAWATKINTTVSSVQKECGNKIGCSKTCGSTSCDYECKGKNCTVTINMVSGGGGRSGSSGTGTKAQ
jgi:hypothetical protein